MVAWRWASRESVRKFTTRHVLGAVLGVVALFLAFVAFLNLNDLAGQYQSSLPRELAFLAPVQQASSPLTVTVANVEDKASALNFIGLAWPALFAILVWLVGWFSESRSFKSIGWIWLDIAGLGRIANAQWCAGFSLDHCGLSARARCDSGIAADVVTAAASSQPGGSCRGKRSSARGDGLADGGVVCMSCAQHSFAAGKEDATGASRVESAGKRMHAGSPSPQPSPQGEGEAKAVSGPIAQRVIQEIRVEDKFALATARIHWQAEKGQTLPLLLRTGSVDASQFSKQCSETCPGNGQLEARPTIVAEKSGANDIEVQYEVRITKKEQETGFTLPVQYGLVNRLELTVLNNDVDVVSSQAVSVQRELPGAIRSRSSFSRRGSDAGVDGSREAAT